MKIDFRSNARRQSGTSESFAMALVEQAHRWRAIDRDDPAVRPLLLAADVIRQLSKLYMRDLKATFEMLLESRQQTRTAATRSAALSVKLAEAERELVSLRAEKIALSAIASGLRSSRTTHRRDAAGELVESVTEFIGH